jgi:GH25 family lysozyme M1 (1,4-beta-N-acetylmuramidase)
LSYIGVDVSYANGNVNLSVAKSHGLQFCIIRIGYGSNMTSQDDTQFINNYNKCKQLHIPCGGYFYSYAMNEVQAQSEALHIKRLLTGRHFEMPVFADMEDADGYKGKHGGIPSAATNTAIIKTLCSAILSTGNHAGYYCNKDWYNNRLYPAQLVAYDFWYARPNISSPDKPCTIWQSKFGELGGSFTGIGSCDVDVCYKNYGTVVASNPNYCDTTGNIVRYVGLPYTFKSGSAIKCGDNSFIQIATKQDNQGYYYTTFRPIKPSNGTGFYVNNKRVCIMITKPYCDTTSLKTCPQMTYTFKTIGQIKCGGSNFTQIAHKVVNGYDLTTFKALSLTAGVGFYLYGQRVCIAQVVAPWTDTPQRFTKKLGETYCFKSNAPIVSGSPAIFRQVGQSVFKGGFYYTTFKAVSKGQCGFYIGTRTNIGTVI